MNNLLYVISYCFPSSKNAQLGRFVLDQCIELKNTGYNIVVLNVNRSVKCRRGVRFRQENGLQVVETDIYPFALVKFPKVTVFRYTEKLRKLYRAAIKKYGPPNLLYAHFSFPTGFAVRRISKEESIPYMVMEHHSLFYRDKLNSWIVSEMKNTIDDSAAFISVSSALQEAIQEHCNSKQPIRIVHNIINTTYTYSPPSKSDVFHFFSAGNLVKGKQFDLLIEAVETLKKKGLRCDLRIAGDGELRTYLESMIFEKELGETVTLLGRISKEDMLNEYDCCNAFVLPSKQETYGIVYREAMIVGRPVISTKNGGIEEDWDDAYGILIDNDTTIEVAQAMEKMINIYDSYDFKRISDMAYHSCSAESIREQLSQIIEEAKCSAC